MKFEPDAEIGQKGALRKGLTRRKDMTIFYLNQYKDLLKAVEPKFTRVAAWSVFPLMFINTVLTQQPEQVLFLIGRIAGWFSLLSAFIVIYSTLTSRGWRFFTLFLVAGFMLAKIGRMASCDADLYYNVYSIFYCGLFFLAGACIAFYYHSTILKQTIVFCVLSFPVMAYQLAGSGDWIQILRTDRHNEYEDSQHPTLFVPKDKIIITTFKARPAGLSYANNHFSIVFMFCLAIFYGLSRTRRLTLYDALLCAIAVLSMAKIVFSSMAVILLRKLFMKDNDEKARYIKIGALLMLMMTVYYSLFPGVFNYTMSVDNLKLNYLSRFDDLAGSFAKKSNDRPSAAIIKPEANGEPQITSGLMGKPQNHQSGYAQIGKFLYVIIIGALPFIPFLIKSFRNTRRNYPEIAELSLMCLIIILLMPLITSFLTGCFFWFVTSFIFPPVFIQLGYFKAAQRCSY